VNAQQANDRVDAIVDCGNSIISSHGSGHGIQQIDATINACGYEESNSLWLNVTIATGGTLAFTIRPDNSSLEVDYDFFVFGPNNGCGNFDTPIRCNTTNPIQASLPYNTTGLRDSEIDPTGGPGVNGNGYVSSIQVTAGQQYYILVDRPIGSGGFNLEWTGTAGFLPSPVVNEPNNLEVCANEPSTFLDLTQQEATITSSPTAVLSYYTSYADAFDNNNRITDPTQFQYSGNYTNIFVRVTNPNGCFEIVDFDISPLVFDDPPIYLEYLNCDSDRNGTEDFDIPPIISQVESFISNLMEFSVSLHPNESDAIANANSLMGATYTAADGTNIYARITSALSGDCFITYPISLVVLEDPYPASINLVQCDIDETNSLDGITQTDLNQAFLGVTNVEIFYYESLEDRNSDRPINNATNYVNSTPFNQTLYYRVISNLCVSSGEINLEVNPTTISLNTTSPIMVCADGANIAEGTFDIESIRQANYAGLDVAFYANRTDFTLEQNPIEGNLITASQTLFIRLETNNQCQGAEQIELVVNPLPTINLENSYEVCTDGEPLLIDAPSGFDTYTWYRTDTTSSQEIETTAQVSISEAGNYQLEVSTVYENSGQMISCFSTTNFIVTPSNRAVIQEIEIEDASDSNSFEVFVTGDGDYEYSIDNENYQDESFFENIAAGFYTVYVRDKNGCGITEEEVAIIGFPKFFTPNGDGINENWQIIGAREGLIAANITIYDRFGKLLRQFDASDLGWDGTFNGRQLPASDYWFNVSFSDGKQFKGHFSLKR